MKLFRLNKALPLLLGIALFIGGCCNPEIAGNVPNVLRPQETDNWCWAATTQMLAQHFSISVTQCSLSNQDLGRTDCCNPASTAGSCPKNAMCNQPGWPMLDFVGLKFSEDTTPMTWAALREEIFCNKRPMAHAYGTPNVVGHVRVIKGYVTLEGTNYLVINDPWKPCKGEEKLITYAEYADPAGTATHWSTFHNLAKK